MVEFGANVEDMFFLNKHIAGKELFKLLKCETFDLVKYYEFLLLVEIFFFLSFNDYECFLKFVKEKQ